MTPSDINDARQIGAPAARFREVLASVSAQTYVTPREILGKSRVREIAHARQLTCSILRSDGMSYPRIGRMMGLDHSTVRHACEAVAARRAQV